MEKVAAHASVVDTKKGFGGKFGVQTDRVDKVSRVQELQLQAAGTNGVICK